MSNPKCFGHYMDYPTCEGHHDCAVSGKCFSERSFTEGACDCPHKRSCHIPRQWLQNRFKEENPKHVCSFIQYFKEENK